MGLNARNLDYVLKKKSLPQIKIANNKLLVKKILKKSGLPVMDNYFVIRNEKEFKEFDWNLPKSFVIKPNRGLGGEGVLIVYGKKKNAPVWIKAGQKLIPLENIKHHVFNILEGNFTLEDRGDVAFFEERVKLHPAFKPYTFKGGIPDIRVVVYEKIPVMAELRLPTKESEGKGNLHLGGIGVGIDLKTGITTTAIQHDRPIDSIPEKRLVLSDIQVPFWKEVLRIASLAQKNIKIDFLGVDIAIDREKGPVVLEVNGRPGISIQLANHSPLRERLERVENLNVKTSKRGTKISQELFGGEIEEELRSISGRKVLGIFEPIRIVLPDKRIDVLAKIDTGAYRTSIDKKLAQKLGIKETEKTVKISSSLGADRRPLANLKFELGGKTLDTQVSIADRSHVKYEMIIGRRDLGGFLLNPNLKPKSGLEK